MKKINFLKLMMFVGFTIMVISTIFINDKSSDEEVERATYIQALGLVMVLPFILKHEQDS